MCWTPVSHGASGRDGLPIDATVVRRLLRAIERSLRVLRSLRQQGRAAFVTDEIVQDRAARHAQLLAQACADVALHFLAPRRVIFAGGPGIMRG